MKFLLKRRLNPFLLVTTVIVLALLAGLSIIYQTQFDDIVSDKQSMQEELYQERAAAGELENKTDAQNQEISNLENRTEELEEEAEEAQMSSEERDDTVESLQGQIENLEGELGEVRDERDTLDLQMTNICEDNQKSETAEEECSVWDEDES